MREDFKPYLFTLFRQEEEGYSRRYEGAGLGLAISQRLVEAMEGRIEVLSGPGEGSSLDQLEMLQNIPVRRPFPRQSSAA